MGTLYDSFDYNLYAGSMNPVMERVSFCMISGILAADCIIKDRR